MDILGTLHLLLAVVAILAGAGVLLRPKGTRRHRRLGRLYAAGMVGLNGTALMIYDLFGGFGPFHWLALVSLGTLAVAWYAVRRRPKGWLRIHGEMMSWSYVGLLAALVAEIVSRLPDVPFAASVWVSSLLVVAAGGVVLKTRLPATLRRMPANAHTPGDAPRRPAWRRDEYAPRPQQPDGRTER